MKENIDAERNSIIKTNESTEQYLKLAEDVLNQSLLFKLAIKQGGKPFGSA